MRCRQSDKNLVQEVVCGDRRIEMMTQRFEDFTISMTDYLSGLVTL